MPAEISAAVLSRGRVRLVPEHVRFPERFTCYALDAPLLVGSGNDSGSAQPDASPHALALPPKGPSGMHDHKAWDRYQPTHGSNDDSSMGSPEQERIEGAGDAQAVYVQYVAPAGAASAATHGVHAAAANVGPLSFQDDPLSGLDDGASGHDRSPAAGGMGVCPAVFRPKPVARRYRVRPAPVDQPAVPEDDGGRAPRADHGREPVD